MTPVRSSSAVEAVSGDTGCLHLSTGARWPQCVRLKFGLKEEKSRETIIKETQPNQPSSSAETNGRKTGMTEVVITSNNVIGHLSVFQSEITHFSVPRLAVYKL